jgi:Bacteriocin-protection, YdeI or OmpD-Associated/Domain of unknown function (DUF1905)
MKTTYVTNILQVGNNTGIPVPLKNLHELGDGKRPQVSVTVNRYKFSSTVGSMDHGAIIPFSKAHRETSGIVGGDMVTVTLELDTSPRDTPLPHDAKLVLTEAKLLEVWKDLAPSHKKEYVRWITEAKKPETRESRVKKMCMMLASNSFN